MHMYICETRQYKQTIRTGTQAAAKGGFTLVCSMPNLNPVPDSAENMAVQQEIIDRDAVIKVLPYASITKGEKGAELVNFRELYDKCFAFSDDGKGVQKDEMMLAAMEKDFNPWADVEKGDLSRVTAWLGEKIHRHGRLLTPPQLLRNAIGTAFEPACYVDYLTKKFTALYRL